MITKTRPYVVPPEMPKTGYEIRKVERRNGSSDPYLFVELTDSAYPLHLKEDFATHVRQFLQASHPKLTVAVEPFSEGKILSVIGYDEHETRVEINITSGDIRDRQIVVQPSLDKYIASNGTKNIDPRETIENYMRVLERDLVK